MVLLGNLKKLSVIDVIDMKNAFWIKAYVMLQVKLLVVNFITKIHTVLN